MTYSLAVLGIDGKMSSDEEGSSLVRDKRYRFISSRLVSEFVSLSKN